jgi:putative nucleotidyltransferase with HDIG domain
VKRQALLAFVSLFLLVAASTLILSAELRAAARDEMIETARASFETVAELSAEGISTGYFAWTELRDLVVAGEYYEAAIWLAEIPVNFRYALAARIVEGVPPEGTFTFVGDGSSLTATFRISDSNEGGAVPDHYAAVALDAPRMLGETSSNAHLSLALSGGQDFAFGLRVVSSSRPLAVQDWLVAILLATTIAMPVAFMSRRNSRFFYESKGLATIIFLFEQSDRFSANHSRNVAAISLFLGKKADISGKRLRDLYSAALLHDIGKISVPASIVQKPGSLDAGERETVREHAIAGARILENFRELSHLSEFVLRHHERGDGSGYPGGLKVEDIPLESRIIAVADVYEALSGERSYRSAVSSAEAIAIMRSEELDREVVDLLERNIGEFAAFTLPRWARTA